MTPEARNQIAKARQTLEQASLMQQHGFHDGAGRNAYMAGHQAAIAFIFDRTGRVVKTHGGAQSEFHRLLRNEARFEPEDRQFLGKTYDYKQSADYGIGPVKTVTKADAEEAMAQAAVLIDKIEAVLKQETTEDPPP